MSTLTTKLAIALAAALLSTAACAEKILPDACGNDKVKFDVDTKKDQPRPASPEDGKAQIVFLGTLEDHGGFIGSPTTRYGMDGTWVGANKGNSYFVLTVAPGEHHLCADWSKGSGVASFTAEPGKVYFYEAKIVRMGKGHSSVLGPGGYTSVGGAPGSQTLYFTPLSDDEGKFRVKASALSTFTSK